MLFLDRKEAGQKLASELSKLPLALKTAVFGLARGGVAVAKEIADSLQLDLDILLVRKLGAPSNPEFAIGAVSETEELILDSDIINYYNISADYIETQLEIEKHRLTEYQALFRQSRPIGKLTDRSVIVVDDGIATGHTMLAAVRSLIDLEAREIIVAVPVAPEEVLSAFLPLVDDIICLHTPDPFQAVGRYYELFDQLATSDVLRMLGQEVLDHD